MIGPSRECTTKSVLSKTSAEDAGAYRTWVLAVGQKVADAAKEGGVLVSDQEQALLKELDEALNVSAWPFCDHARRL